MLKFVVGIVLFTALGAGGGAYANEQADSYAAHREWKRELVRMLRSAADSDSRLAALMIASESEPRLSDSLGRVFSIAHDDPKALYFTAIASPCDSAAADNQPSCDLARRSSLELTRSDPENALSWLTRAYIASRSNLGDEVIDEALKRAVAAPRFHDYSHDLLKSAIASTAKLPIPSNALPVRAQGRMSVDEARMEAIGLDFFPFVSEVSSILRWVVSGCSNQSGVAVSRNRNQLCANAKDLFKRGDSQVTLSADRQVAKAIAVQFDAFRRYGASGDAEAQGDAARRRTSILVDSFRDAKSERELW